MSKRKLQNYAKVFLTTKLIVLFILISVFNNCDTSSRKQPPQQSSSTRNDKVESGKPDTKAGNIPSIKHDPAQTLATWQGGKYTRADFNGDLQAYAILYLSGSLLDAIYDDQSSLSEKLKGFVFSRILYQTNENVFKNLATNNKSEHEMELQIEPIPVSHQNDIRRMAKLDTYFTLLCRLSAWNKHYGDRDLVKYTKKCIYNEVHNLLFAENLAMPDFKLNDPEGGRIVVTFDEYSWTMNQLNFGFSSAVRYIFQLKYALLPKAIKISEEMFDTTASVNASISEQRMELNLRLALAEMRADIAEFMNYDIATIVANARFHQWMGEVFLYINFFSKIQTPDDNAVNKYVTKHHIDLKNRVTQLIKQEKQKIDPDSEENKEIISAWIEKLAVKDIINERKQEVRNVYMKGLFEDFQVEYTGVNLDGSIDKSELTSIADRVKIAKDKLPVYPQIKFENPKEKNMENTSLRQD